MPKPRSASWRHHLLLAALLSLCALPARAQDPDDELSLRIGWLLFGDLYHVFSNHQPDVDEATGAVLRRGYLTFDAEFGKHWFGRLRFELNQSGEFETYDFEADVKDFFIGRDLGAHRLLVGLAPTPTFDVIERAWGLRYLMRTPMDLQGVASRDKGVWLGGPMGSSNWSYRAMAGTGIEFGAERGDGRKSMLGLNWKIDEHWMLDFYAGYERLPGPADRLMLQGFAAYQADDWRWGIQYSDQDRDQQAPLRLASSYWVGKVAANRQLIARIDRIFEPSPKGDNISYIPFDPTAPATLYLVGLEFMLNPHFRLTPNAIVIEYGEDEQGQTPETDVQLRLTLFVDFE